MNRVTRRLAVAGVLAGAVSLVLAAPAPVATVGVVKDRENFIPTRKYAPMPGKVTALLVSDVAAKMSHEGRGGPPDAMGLSLDGGSYRWIYVPVENRADAIIFGLNVKAGEKGELTQHYPLLNMANARSVKKWDIGVPYALVEVEVNGGQGAPADESFAATKMTRLDGTKAYPFNVTETVAELKKRYAEWKKEQQTKLDDAMLDAQKKAIQDRKPTGPRETQELVYLTWMARENRLCVRFRTTLTDGEYKYTQGGRLPRDRFPLPPNKLPAPGGQQPQARAAFPPPPLERPSVRYGTSFGIEYGMEYQVTPTGKVDRILTLSADPFKKELPPPPGGRFDRGPVDRLPPMKLPPIRD